MADGPAQFVHAPRARKLVIWLSDRVETFQADPDGSWSEYGADFGGRVNRSSYDPLLEAFVAVTLREPDPRVRVTPIDGSPASVNPIELPPGAPVEAVGIGSGRVFALTTAEAGGHELLWWDAPSGVLAGSQPVGRVSDGARLSSNGRMLALWDLDAYRVTLVDTAAPERPRVLRLGACRSNGMTEASADGRWFLFQDCAGHVRAADLAAGGSSSRAIGLRRPANLGFAADTPELVWVDRQGRVFSHNLTTGQRLELLQLNGPELEDFDRWSAQVHLNRSADLLALSTGRGTVRVQSVAAPEAAMELPPLDIDRAALHLTAEPIAGDGADHYDFTGTFTLPDGEAAGEPLAISGSVHSDRLHRYLPSGPALKPSALAPPRVGGTAVVREPLSGEEQFHLTFSTYQRNATAFRGALHDMASGVRYRIVLERNEATGE